METMNKNDKGTCDARNSTEAAGRVIPAAGVTTCNKSPGTSRYSAGFLAAGLAIAGLVLIPEAALCAFNIDAGIKAGTDPIVKALKDYWSLGVLLGSGGMAIMGEGDLRQRATRAAIGAGAAGGTILGLIALLS